jgi:hypothetical protein
MADSIWRFFLYDLRTREVLAELPVVDGSVTFGDVLNAPGSAKFALPLDPPDPVGLTASMLTPPNAGFAAEAGGLIRWAGPIVTHPTYDFAAGTVEYGCEGLWSYVRRRVSQTTHIFDAASAVSANGWVPAGDNGVGWRDANIAKHLLDTMQTISTFGIVTGDPVSVGTMSELTLPAYERRIVGEIIEQQAATEGGFDFRLEPSWTDGPNSEITYLWRPSYPATGRQTDIVWDGSSARIVSATVDPTNIAYRVHVTGQGTGEQMPVATVTDDVLKAANVLLEATESASNVITSTILERHANRRLVRGAAPVVTPKIELPVSELGSFIVGDQVQVSYTYGLFSVDEWYRITAYEVDISAGVMSVTAAPSSLFA